MVGRSLNGQVDSSLNIIKSGTSKQTPDTLDNRSVTPRGQLIDGRDQDQMDIDQDYLDGDLQGDDEGDQYQANNRVDKEKEVEDPRDKYSLIWERIAKQQEEAEGKRPDLPPPCSQSFCFLFGFSTFTPRRLASSSLPPLRVDTEMYRLSSSTSPFFFFLGCRKKKCDQALGGQNLGPSASFHHGPFHFLIFFL